MPTVLLIEDDAESRRATAELFLREDWKILEAGDGELGIKFALEHRPELVLCDLLMPKVNGFRVCRSIKQSLPQTKIIIVSGRDYGVDRKSAMDAGAHEYLVKPISWDQLHQVIDRILPESGDGAWQTSPVPQFSPPSTRVKFWGVRGSIPVPGSSTVGYGGNTSCVEVRADGEIVILDAGTGMRELGDTLIKEFGDQPIRATLLLSHTHWDHVQGLAYFLPLYDKTNRNSLRVLGYEGAKAGLEAILAGQMETSFFPVNLGDVSAITIDELKEMEFSVGRIKVKARFVKHPGVCVGYRLFTSNGSIAYFPDNEPYDVHQLDSASHDPSEMTEKRVFATEERAKLVEFLRNTDILIIDAQYTDKEYAQKVGWGHGSLSSAVALAVDAEVRKLFLFHHDPTHADKKIDEMVEGARMLVLESGKAIEVEAAREGAEVWLGAQAASAA
jgi:phosphoribosyl 1,2-cyclic phosphodiesterase/CheY-like chemotaxis protein